MKYYIAFVVLGLSCAVFAASTAKVDEKIWKDLKDAKSTNIKVSFRKANTKAANERFHALELNTRNARLNSHYAILKDHADTVQEDVISTLKKAQNEGKKHELAQLWISNELIVRNVDKETVEKLRDHPDVESLEAERFVQLADAVEEPDVATLSENKNQWGVDSIGAPTVWATGNTGSGVVIGFIDTGARATHTALSSQYRGNPGQHHNYNWFDPDKKVSSPIDNDGQGTHVIGTACGGKGIGVAPGARWIACKACNNGKCSEHLLAQCGNWMTCPTDTNGKNPDCSKAPNIVNNSWLKGGNNSFFDAIIENWVDKRIVPIFAAGDDGPNCSTIHAPADHKLAIAVGAVDSDDKKYDKSSVGPPAEGRSGPLTSAPGVGISSASNKDDNSLVKLSGTSMAAPHASGVVALLLTHNSKLTVVQVKNALSGGSIPHTHTGENCGEIKDSNYPNHHVGHGRLSAPKTIEAIPAGY